MQWLSHDLIFCLQFLLISFGTLVVVGACAVVPDRMDWIKIGHTTREEVLERYGQPDLNPIRLIGNDGASADNNERAE